MGTFVPKWIPNILTVQCTSSNGTECGSGSCFTFLLRASAFTLYLPDLYLISSWNWANSTDNLINLEHPPLVVHINKMPYTPGNRLIKSSKIFIGLVLTASLWLSTSFLVLQTKLSTKKTACSFSFNICVSTSTKSWESFGWLLKKSFQLLLGKHIDCPSLQGRVFCQCCLQLLFQILRLHKSVPFMPSLHQAVFPNDPPATIVHLY